MTKTNEEESILINPDEIKKRRIKQKVEVPVIETPTKEEYHNRGDEVEIRYESEGRFALPEKLYFRMFKTSEVHDLVLSKESRLLESLIAVLNECKDNSESGEMGDAHPSEFLETLILIKAQFDTTQHEHFWLCDKCQKDNEDATPQKTILDLNDIIKNFVNISEVDEKLKLMKKERFDVFSDEQFQEYLKLKYKPDEINFETFTREDEIASTKLQEPFQVNSPSGLLLFRFPRVGDLVKAQKFVENKYAGKIKRAQNQSFPDVPKEQLGIKRKEAVDTLKEKRDRDIIMATRAFSLLKRNGEDLTNDEKFKLFSDLNANTMLELTSYLNKTTFGLNQEVELTCEHCGHVNKRWLQRELDFSEFLPINADSERNERKSSQFNIFF